MPCRAKRESLPQCGENTQNRLQQKRPPERFCAALNGGIRESSPGKITHRGETFFRLKFQILF